MGDDVNEDPEHFNPHEDREKRKQVRYEYRELIAETESKLLLVSVIKWLSTAWAISLKVSLFKL